ncbi:DoxX family protein [Amycolatopsis sp. NPDC004772]
MATSQRPAHVLAGALGFMGVLHFAVPKPFDGLIPASLPGSRRAWTYGSGVAELAVAAAVATPRTRRLGGLAAALLFLGVFPGNVKMALDAASAPAPQRAIAWARLPLQWPLIAWALKVRDNA